MNFRTRLLSACAIAGSARVAAEAARNVRLRIGQSPISLPGRYCFLPDLPAMVAREYRLCPSHLEAGRPFEANGGGMRSAVRHKPHLLFTWQAVLATDWANIDPFGG